MTVRILILLFFILTILNGDAQQFTSHELNKEEGKFGDNISIIKSPTGYYSVTHLAKNKFGYGVTLYDLKYVIRVTSYDPQMKIVKSVELFNGEDKIGPFTCRFLKLGGKEILVYYQKQEKNETFDVFASQIDPVTLELKDTKKIFEIEQKNLGIFKIDQIGDHVMHIVTSPDQQRILFLSSSQRNNKYTFAILDRDLNVLKSKVQTIEAAKSISIANTIIANNGDLFVAYQYLQDKKSGNYIRNVLKEGFNESRINIVIETENEVWPHSMSISQGISENEIKVCGAYTADRLSIKGVYMQLIDRNSMTITHKMSKAIPDDLMDKYIEQGFAYKKEQKKGLKDITYFLPLVFEDNTICLVAELSSRSSDSRDLPIFYKGEVLIALLKDNDISYINFSKTTTRTDGINTPQFYPIIMKNKLIFFYDSKKEELLGSIPESFLGGKKKIFFVSSSLTKDGTKSTSLMSGDCINFNGIDQANVIMNPDNSLTVPQRIPKGLGFKQIITYYLFKPIGE